MNIIRENIDELNAILKVTISKEDYLPKLEEGLKNAKKNINLNGFRKGMVPTGIVKKMYGNAILFEELNKVIGEATNQYFKEENLNILGRPLQKNMIEEVDINQPTDVELEYEIGLAPEIDLSKIEGLAVSTQTLMISEEDVEKELENLRKRYGVSSEIESYQDEADIINVSFAEMADDKEKENGIKSHTSITLSMIKDKKLSSKIQQSKKGDAFEVDIFKDFDREKEAIAKHILGLKEGVPADMSEDFNMTITSFQHLEPAELNQELFDKVFGADRVTTLEQAKEALRTEMSNYFVEMAENRKKQSIIDAVLGRLNLELPDDFLKRWLMTANEKPLTQEQIEAEYPHFSHDLRWTIVSAKMQDEHDLRPNFDDIKAYSKEQTKKQFERFSPNGEPISEETIEMISNQMLAKEDYVKKSYDAVLEQKLFDFLQTKLTVSAEAVALEDFFKKN
ncbi:MAG: trigger factor [Chitinophagales bacterium]|nr:trigger factor [Chitinophagales bacterium]